MFRMLWMSAAEKVATHHLPDCRTSGHSSPLTRHSRLLGSPPVAPPGFCTQVSGEEVVVGSELVLRRTGSLLCGTCGDCSRSGQSGLSVSPPPAPGTSPRHDRQETYRVINIKISSYPGLLLVLLRISMCFIPRIFGKLKRKIKAHEKPITGN